MARECLSFQTSSGHVKSILFRRMYVSAGYEILGDSKMLDVGLGKL